MANWARPAIDRKQAMIFCPTLEDAVGEDHPVRLFEELLELQDWSEWEAAYTLKRGQPPIHPRIMAGAILYGLGRKIVSSRQLEDACNNRIDFMWLVEGRRIDHSTFAKFRTTHKSCIEQLFKDVCKVARQLGLISLEEVATDGTRIEANSSRYQTKSAAELSQWISELEDRIAEALAEMALTDERDDSENGVEGTPQQLPPQLRSLFARKELLKKAHAAVESIEKKREEKRQADPNKVAKVPVSDPDARILKNKTGGFSPNYTPGVSADGAHGFIVSAGITNSTAEHQFQIEAVVELNEMFGELPDFMLGDGLYTDLDTITTLDSQGVTVLAPVKSTGAREGDVAYREDPTEPVSSELVEELPVTKKAQRFTRDAFIFDVDDDCFYCPMGKQLCFRAVTTHKKSSQKEVQTRVYKASKEDCMACIYKKKCVPDSQNERRVERMVRSEILDKVAHHMSQTVNKERYNRRKLIAESPFAHIKHAMGIRRFLHRGKDKVQTEWKWICTAYNINKLLRLVTRTDLACLSALRTVKSG